MYRDIVTNDLWAVSRYVHLVALRDISEGDIVCYVMIDAVMIMRMCWCVVCLRGRGSGVIMMSHLQRDREPEMLMNLAAANHIDLLNRRGCVCPQGRRFS